MSRLVFAFMWLLRFLPPRLIAAVGEGTGTLFFWLIPERRKVTRINLAKCFPQMPDAERERLARAHFRAFCRSFVERGVLWWSSKSRIERLVTIEGVEHLACERVIILAPHFLGFEATALRLSIDRRIAMMYSKQKDPLFDRLLYEGRARFGSAIFPRINGGRRALAEVSGGAALFYLPDLDFGPKHAVFVPFFGVPAATVTGLSYIARTTGARVVPCVTRMLPGGGYAARLYPPWSGFPSGDDAADARRLMAFVEERVLEMPEQYLWLHKRFKTRPAGEARFY